MQHTIATILAALETDRHITLTGTDGRNRKTVTGRVAQVRKVTGSKYQIEIHEPGAAMGAYTVHHLTYFLPKDENPPKITGYGVRVVSRNRKTKEEKVDSESRSVKVEREEGLHLSDLIAVVNQRGMIGDDPRLALCIRGRDTDDTRFVYAIHSLNDPADGPGGVMYLHLDPETEKEVNEAVGE
jgi:hypothetical protein